MKRHTFEWEQGTGLEMVDAKPLEIESGEMIEVDLTLTPKHREIIDGLISLAIANNYNQKWTYYRLIEQYPDDLIKFTFGDLRYLSTRIKADFEFCKRGVDAAKKLNETLAQPTIPPNPLFTQEVDKLHLIAKERNYKLSWIFYRIQESLPDLNYQPILADWLYLAKILDYPTTWAASQFNKSNSLYRDRHNN